MGRKRKSKQMANSELESWVNSTNSTCDSLSGRTSTMTNTPAPDALRPKMAGNSQSTRTSTPKPQIGDIVSSPSVSSISVASINVLMNNENSNEAASSLQRSASEHSLLVHSIGGQERSAAASSPAPATPTKQTRKIRAYFATHHDGVYKKLLADPPIDVAVHEWLANYKANKETAILDVLQLIVDSCGFFKMRIADFYDWHKPECKNIFDFLESHPTKQHQGNFNHYLFKTNAKWAQNMQDNICRFFLGIICLLYRDRLLRDHLFFSALLPFIYQMCGRQTRVLRHTGVVIAIKLTTILTKVGQDIVKEVDSFSESSTDVSSDADVVTALNDQKQVEEIMNVLSKILMENYNLSDDWLKNMRNEYAKEMVLWCNMNPKYFLQKKYVKSLLKLVVDHAHEVRLSAIKTCSHLTARAEYKEFVGPHLNSFFSSFAGRMLDINYEVAIAAVDAFTEMIPIYSTEIPLDHRTTICQLIYNKYYPLAASAGQFLLTVLHFHGDFQPVSNEATLRNLVTTHQTLATRAHIPVLVEATFNCAEWNNWNAIIDLLLTNELETEFQEDLLEIMCQHFIQIFTGRSPISRVKSRAARPSQQLNHKLQGRILKRLPPLLKKCKDNIKCLTSIVHLLENFNFATLTTTENFNITFDIFNYFTAIYGRTNNEAILELITNLLAVIMKESYPISEGVETVMSVIGKSATERFLTNRDRDDKDVDLEFDLLTLSVLFTKIDLTAHLQWEQLDVTDSVNAISKKTVMYILKSRHWFLIWQMRNLLQCDEDQESLNSLVTRFHNFLGYENGSITILAKSTSPSTKAPDNLTKMTFTCICELLLIFNEEIKSARNRFLKNFFKEFQDLAAVELIEFSQRIILNEYDCTFEYRVKSLDNIVKLIFEGVISNLYISHITQHYYTLYADFKGYFDEIFFDIRKSGIHYLAAVLVDTIRIPFEKQLKVEKDGESFDFKSQGGKDLKHLAGCLQKLMAAEIDTLKMSIQMAIKYVLQSKNYTFLALIGCFADNLPNTVHREVKVFLLDNVPEEDLSNRFVLKFVGRLNKNMGIKQ